MAIPDNLKKTFETDYCGKRLIVETGYIAEQANGAVMLRLGDTALLITAVASKAPREGIDFFPLTCDYEEKLYAAGRIPGSFPRREGRPSEAATITSRMIDRPMRPLFPKDFRNDVQIVATVLSTDQEQDPADARGHRRVVRAADQRHSPRRTRSRAFESACSTGS